MQVPHRKPGQYTHAKPDPQITQAKFDELTRKLDRLKTIRPEAAAQVAQLAELGDFSENMEYQLAKGRLRGINNGILKLEAQLIMAQIIPANKNSNSVQLGSKVTVSSGEVSKTFLILGSEESDPNKNIISYNSPLGSALIGRAAGDKVTLKLASKEVEYNILNIE